MSELNITDLSFDELKEQCRILGLSAAGSTNTLRERLLEALGEDAPQAEVQKDRKADWVTIQISEDPTNSQPVFVGHNGKSYFIRRGEPVEVPPHVVDVLKHAIEVVYDAEGKARKVPAYPFQIL